MVKRARKVTKSGRKSTLSVNRLLTRDLLEDTSRLGDGITGLTDADVDDELLNSDVTHDISLLALQRVSRANTTTMHLPFSLQVLLPFTN